MLLDELADVLDRAGRLRAAHQEQVLAVAGDPLEARPQPLVRGQAGAARPLGDPRGQDLLADVLDLDRARLLGQVHQRGFHRHEPVEEVLLVVLEADVEDVGLAAGGHVAGHLKRHRGLAGALGAADEQQLARSQPAADGLVEHPKPSGTGWYSPNWPVARLSFRSTSTSSAERGTRLPLSVSSRQIRSEAVASEF